VGHLKKARHTCSLAGDLTAQLVTFAEGGAPIRKAIFLSEMIEDLLGPVLSGSNVRGEFSLAKDLWPAEADAQQIGQVLRNLVLNAREAMPHGGVVAIRAENVVLSDYEQPSLPRGDYVRVSITDHGAGIADDVLPKIFDPYFSTKQRGHQKGMGLGLTICHSVILKHAGAIAVESKVGVGTTFHIYLPAARKLTSGERAAVPAAIGRQGKVLVMDDDDAVREILGVTLQQMGHEVATARDGQMAVEIYGKAHRVGRPFDTVILDLTVSGGMGGRETIQALLQLDPMVKAIVMSGYGHDRVILEHDRYGFKGALTKPFDPEELEEILNRVMGS
jgi:CheY-like chemotaxis protein